MFVPMSHTLVCSIYIHIRQKQKILDSYDKWEPGFEFVELPAHEENGP